MGGKALSRALLLLASVVAILSAAPVWTSAQDLGHDMTDISTNAGTAGQTQTPSAAGNIVNGSDAANPAASGISGTSDVPGSIPGTGTSAGLTQPASAGQSSAVETCTVSWECTDWLPCMNGSHFRECWESSSCSGGAKPSTSRDCYIESPSIQAPFTEPMPVHDTGEAGQAETTQAELSEIAKEIADARNAQESGPYSPAVTDENIVDIAREVISGRAGSTNGAAATDAEVERTLDEIMKDPELAQEVWERPREIASHLERNITASPEKPSEIDIEEKDIGFREILMEVKNPVSGALMNITRLSHQPAGVPKAAGMNETAYQYIEIAHENVSDSDIKNITITFSVNMSWIAGQMADENGMYLARFDSRSSAWARLPTRLVNRTMSQAYYEAMSPGLSIFSIISGTTLRFMNRTCVPYDVRCYGDALQECDMAGQEWETRELCRNGCADMVCVRVEAGKPVSTSSAWTGMVVAGILVMLVGAVAYYFESKRDRLRKEIRSVGPMR